MDQPNDDLETNWCLSGGAIGADLAWGEAASKMGHKVTHFSFEGHRSRAPSSQIVVLSDDRLLHADPHLLRANAKLGRTYPPRSGGTQKLLQRNWYQVETAGSCYAVSTIKDGMVDGGTAWALQLFIDLHGGAPCRAYVFDQEKCCWWQWTGGWERIYTPPKPQGIWAGIGTRKLNFVGRLAINVLLDYWPRERTIWMD